MRFAAARVRKAVPMAKTTSLVGVALEHFCAATGPPRARYLAGSGPTLAASQSVMERCPAVRSSAYGSTAAGWIGQGVKFQRRCLARRRVGFSDCSCRDGNQKFCAYASNRSGQTGPVVSYAGRPAIVRFGEITR